MSGPFAHSPADVIRQLLIDHGFGSDDDTGSWPIKTASEPTNPDDVITLYDTEGINQARTMADGARIIHHGFQVRVRGTDYDSGYEKANEIALGLDAAYKNTVHVGSNTYYVHAIKRRGDVLSLGTETEASARVLFTINATATMKQV